MKTLQETKARFLALLTRILMRAPLPARRLDRRSYRDRSKCLKQILGLYIVDPDLAIKACRSKLGAGWMESNGVDPTPVTAKARHLIAVLGAIYIYFRSHSACGDEGSVRAESDGLNGPGLNLELAQQTGIVVDFHRARAIHRVHARSAIVAGSDNDVGLGVTRQRVE